jgi:hypothetical protein
MGVCDDERRRSLTVRAAAVALLTPIAIVAAVATSAASAAPTPSVRRIVASSVSFASDGSRYVAWQTRRPGPITVLDTLHGARHTIPAPSGCELASQAEDGEPETVAATGRFLLVCGPNHLQQAVLDARTSVSTGLPGGAYFSWSRLGSAFAEGQAVGPDCAQAGREPAECVALYSLSTGAVSARQASPAFDLDQSGPKSVCSRLNRAAIQARVNPSFHGYRDGLAARDARDGHDVSLERCNGSTRTIRNSGVPRDFDLRGAVITWDTANGTEARAEYSPANARGAQHLKRSLFAAELTGYDLRTHARHVWKLPRLPVSGGETEVPPSIWGFSTHTATMVFWIATRTLSGSTVRTFSIYGAHF